MMKQPYSYKMETQDRAFPSPELLNSAVLYTSHDIYMAGIDRRTMRERNVYNDACELEGELQYDTSYIRAIDLTDDMDSICVQLRSASIDEQTGELNANVDDISIDGPKTILATDAKHIYKQDPEGDTHVHIAIIFQNVHNALGYIDMAPAPEYLSIQNELFQSPLHLSALTNLPEVARRLVVGGADIESRDKAGNTPLHLACREGHSDIVDAILKTVSEDERRLNMYDVQYKDTRHVFEIPNYEGLPCIHLAALKGHYTLVSKLVELGADINSYERKSGRTLLHKAAAEGDVDVVKMLLTVPSLDIDARAFDDRTPFDLARDRGFHEITVLLATEGTRRAVQGDV